MKAVRWLAVAAALFAAGCAREEVKPQQLANVTASPQANAALPLSLSFSIPNGKSITVAEAIAARPSVLLFADFTCSSLCGPTLSLIAHSLAESGLQAGSDFRLVVIGIDPKDSAADARAMKQKQLPAGFPAVFLRGDESDIHAATNALGYRYEYDPQHDQFAHSADAYVLDASGHVSRVLNGLTASARDLRLALVGASNREIGTFRDHLQLLCYGFDPSKGTYSVAVNRILAAACCLTVLSLAGMILLLSFGRPKRA
ncbi:MAG TPA: SCO family protein [Xanthobacteraceae bacterium]|nr:SCO family protein [Xanthobacteraceae bacterium]